MSSRNSTAKGTTRLTVIRVILLVLLISLTGSAGAWQTPDHQQGLPDPIPAPKPRKPIPEDTPAYTSVLQPSEIPWGLDAGLQAALADKARAYRQYARRFTCDETAVVADYGGNGEVTDERIRKYGYLLIKNADRDSISELRQEIDRKGNLKAGAVQDEEPFPAAYQWVFLFSEFNETFFAMRYLGERFDGFDWIHEIEFKGSMPFSDGKDIRQWEGRVLIDAVTYTPLEIIAEPSSQKERIEGMYHNWSKSFNILGMRTAPKPLGYRAQVQFRFRRDDVALTFPTEVRYDTFRAVSPTQIVPTLASTRKYTKYRITVVKVQQESGDKVEP